MNTGKRSILYFQQDSQPLGTLFTQLAKIREWNRLLADSLAPEDHALLQHCKVIHADPTGFMIMVDSPHWATRLRFLTPTLISTLKKRAGMENITAIQHRIALPHSGQAVRLKKSSTKFSLSPGNSRLLLEAAEEIRHPKLKAALKKLAEKRNR